LLQRAETTLKLVQKWIFCTNEAYRPLCPGCKSANAKPPATVNTYAVGDRRYAAAIERQGSARLKRQLGCADDPEVVLVGTAAYIAYSAALGVVLPRGLAVTQDVDLSIVS
jgi:hypothetical protein